MKTGVFMKKKIIVIGSVVLSVILLIVAVLFAVNSDNRNNQSATVAYEKAQLGITVDSWLKINGIDEYYGVLAVEVENVSDTDVEYALLTVKTRTETLSFNVSALLSGTKAVLLCNESVAANPEESYTAWQTDNMILFEKPPVMNEDKFEVSLMDGSISLKNISGEDIASDIYIYYKDMKEELLNGSVTYKISVAGLKADSVTYIKTEGLNENNCRIIFTEYDDKEV